MVTASVSFILRPLVIVLRVRVDRPTRDEDEIRERKKGTKKRGIGNTSSDTR